MAGSCIPNKTNYSTVWSTMDTIAIKRYVRKRKRAYRTARLTNEDRHWTKFRQLRSKVTAMIRDSKKSYKQSLSDQLKSGTLSSKQWWSVLKASLSQNNSSSIPPLEKDGIVYSDETDNANLLNNFFRDQGPVVQSVVSLTSSLRVISLTVLADTFFRSQLIWIYTVCKGHIRVQQEKS